MFKRPENIKAIILKNVSTAEKIENYISAYHLFEWIEVFDRMNKIHSFEHS